MKKTKTRPIHSIDRAIDLLMLFSENDTRLTISEMSERLGVPKTTVRGIVNTLSNRNLLEQRDGSAEYTLGGVMFLLGMKYMAISDVISKCSTFMERLAFKYHESVNVCLAVGRTITIVMRYAPDRSHISHPAGSAIIPTHASCSGKTLLAFMNDEQREYMLENYKFEAITPKTLTTREDFIKEIDEVRRTRISFDNEEYIPGMAGIGGPIFGATGSAIAAFSVFGTAEKIYSLQKDIISEILFTSAQLTSKLNIG